MLNRVILMGRLTADPELRQTPNGISVTSFSVAVDRSFLSQSGERVTDFINCVAWRQTAEFITKYFSKGRMIAVEGMLQVRRYTDQQGNNRTATEVVVDNASFCGSKAETGGASQTSPQPKPAAAPQTPAAPNFEKPAEAGESFSVGDLKEDLQGFEELGTDDSNLPF